MFNSDNYISRTQPVPENIRTFCKEFGLHPYTGVLCGWDWAIAHKDLIPVYEMELSNGHHKQSFKCKDYKTASEVMRINRR